MNQISDSFYHLKLVLTDSLLTSVLPPPLPPSPMYSRGVPVGLAAPAKVTLSLPSTRTWSQPAGTYSLGRQTTARGGSEFLPPTWLHGAPSSAMPLPLVPGLHEHCVLHKQIWPAFVQVGIESNVHFSLNSLWLSILCVIIGCVMHAKQF